MQAVQVFLAGGWSSLAATIIAELQAQPSTRIHYCNTRNILREVFLPQGGPPLLIKQQRLNPEYPLNRRISFYLRNFFKHYGRRAYRGATLLLSAGIPTPLPAGYWKVRTGPLQYECCYLVEKIVAVCNAKQLLLSSAFANTSTKASVIQEMGYLAKRIHDNGILHGDLVANNFLLSAIPKGKAPPKLTVIDTDHTRRNPLPLRFGGRILALRCFRRWHFSPAEKDLFLQAYFGGNYNPIWGDVIAFWGWLDRRPLRKLRQLIPGYRVYDKRLHPRRAVAPHVSLNFVTSGRRS